MAKRSKYLLLMGLALLVVGCGKLAIHKTDILQGNYVDESRLENLTLGMTKPEVQLLLGSPLVKDTFDPSIWYYVYMHHKSSGELIERQDLRIHFDESGRVIQVEDGIGSSNSMQLQPLIE